MYSILSSILTLNLSIATILYPAFYRSQKMSSPTSSIITPRSTMSSFCCSLESGETWGLFPLSSETILSPTQRFASIFCSSCYDNTHIYYYIRCGLALYWSIWCILSGLQSDTSVDLPDNIGGNWDDQFHWFLFLTNWTLTVEELYLLSYAILLHYPNNRYLQKFVWGTRNIVASTSLVVAFMYWLLLFDGSTRAVDIHVHLINAIIMLLDMAICRIPLYLKHFYFPFLYSVIYSLFNGIYVGSGGTNGDGEPWIYGVLKFNPVGPSLILLFLVVFVVSPLMFCLSYYWSKFWRSSQREENQSYREDGKGNQRQRRKSLSNDKEENYNNNKKVISLELMDREQHSSVAV